MTYSDPNSDLYPPAFPDVFAKITPDVTAAEDSDCVLFNIFHRYLL